MRSLKVETTSMTAPPACAFCAIINGDAPARIVAEMDSSIAFLPDVPAVLGHTLVVPRAHVRDIWDLDEAAAHRLGNDVLSVARAIRRSLKPQGVNLIQSNGEAAGQTVFHLHVHVVPRQFGDRMPALWPDDAAWSTHQLDSVARTLSRVIEQ